MGKKYRASKQGLDHFFLCFDPTVTITHIKFNILERVIRAMHTFKNSTFNFYLFGQIQYPFGVSQFSQTSKRDSLVI